jgi:hypothetical protein
MYMHEVPDCPNCIDSDMMCKFYRVVKKKMPEKLNMLLIFHLQARGLKNT